MNEGERRAGFREREYDIRPAKWHREPDSVDAAQLLLKRAQEILVDNAQRRAQAQVFASVFDNVQLTSFNASGYGYEPLVLPGIEQPVIKNTMRSIGMTAVAKLTANDTPLSQFMCNAGGWEEQTKTTRMDRFVDVEVEQPQAQFATLHELHRHGATLAINVTGTYLVFFFPADDGVRCELDDSLSVGIEQAGRFGRITSVVRTVWYDADDLAEDFAEDHASVDAIFQNEKFNSPGMHGVTSEGDLCPQLGVKVVQGWFCAYRGAPGREMWILEDGTVLKDDQEYTEKTPPMVKWDFERELYGVWGVPLSRGIYEMFIRENRMLCDMDNAERNSPQCCIVLPKNAEQPGDLDEARGWAIIRSNGDPKLINFVTPPKYNEMTAAFVDRMQEGCQQVSGIGGQHSAAVKAAGTTSGKHEHLVANLFTERFADQERRLIQARAPDSARQIVRALKLVLERDPEFSRVWAHGDQTEEIRAADLDLDLSKYTISIKPVSEDKDTPKARMNKAQGWLEMGIITGTELAALQETYATQQKSALVLAQEQWIEKQIDKWLKSKPEDALDENFYQGPTRWLDLPALLRHVSLAHLQARSRGAPSRVLAWFDKFIAEASAFIDQDKAQAQTNITADPMNSGTVFEGLGAPPPAAPIQPGAPQ